MERGEVTQLLYFGEIHEKIKVFNLVIDSAIFVDGSHVVGVKFKVHKHGVFVFKTNSIIEIPFKGFTIKPLSGQTIKIADQHEIHLRLELKSIQESEKIIPNDLFSSSDEVLKIQCKKCHTEITSHNRKFSRILELPSENWQEYLDNWCCHGSEAITKLKDGLNPREHDCFFGDWYIILHPKAIITQNIHLVKVNKSCQLLCGRCQATLGKLNYPDDESSKNRPCQDINDGVAVQLYKHSISLYCVIDSLSKDIFRNFGEELYLARNFINLTKTRMCHKFIVNKTSLMTNEKDSSIVLIWILNCDTKFVSSLYNAKYADEIEDSTNLFRAVKVLYKSYLDYEFKSLKDEWYRNAQTDIVSFPEEICLKLISFLNENNKIQPRSLRTANGFNVSFLKL